MTFLFNLWQILTRAPQIIGIIKAIIDVVGSTQVQQILEAIRDGDTIANPMKVHSRPPFHVGALLYFMFFGVLVGALWYIMRLRDRVMDDMVVNMVDVGEETGELDTMLYKVADTYDQEVEAATNGLMAMLEPLLVMVLGGIVGFIVIALFMPLIKLITDLSASG